MYIDITYVRNRVREEDLTSLSADKEELKTPNEDRIEALITDAEAKVNNAIYQGGYTTPIASPDDFIKRIVFDIFLYFLYSRKYDDEEMKDVYVRYNKAHSELNKIASGEITLSGAAKRDKGNLRLLVSNKSSADRVFTTTSLNE